MKIVRSSQMPWGDSLQKGKYFNRRKGLGGEKLSCGLWELPPGKKSFPLHAHLVTEEALFVISGAAKVRTPDGEEPIGPGDFVSFPAGGPAHQLLNDGTEPMIYLAMGAGAGVDIVEYPESGKISCAVGAPPHLKRHVFKLEDEAQYFDDDKDAEG